MKSRVNSINHNGCSVCATGKENYTTYNAAHRPNQILYQYDYRDMDGKLFSTVATTLEICRQRRDKWVNHKRLSPAILNRIQNEKRLAKSELAYEIGKIEPYSAVSINYNHFKREEMVSKFNKLFGTEIE